MVEHAGVQLVEEKEAVTALGRPDTVNETDWAVPERRDAEILLEANCPGVTELFPLLEREKSNAGAAWVVALAIVEYPDRFPAASVARTR